MIKDIIESNENISANQKEIKVLKEHFPNCFKRDGSFDIERLANQLRDKVDVTREGYELNFLGKSYAKLLASIDTTTIIRPDLTHNEKEENKNSENIYISGDNLDALKHLLKSYSGKIKCIYIDPPYNTGSDGFVYNDKFTFTVEELIERLSLDEDQAQRIIDMTGRGSASHSAWLTFMYPRLLLARDLLTEDGVIFISIDDNEQANLKFLCDDVFGEENFEGHIHWRRRHNQPNDRTKMIGLVAEHILTYSKNKEEFKKSGVGKVDLTGNYSNPDNDPRGEWASKPWKVGSDQSGSRYNIITPTGKVLNEEWMGDENTFKVLLKDNRIIFPRGGDGNPRKKYFRFEREQEGQCANNWWEHEEFGHNQGANECITNLFGKKNIFSNPKPIELVRGIIQLSNAKENDIILDFFSGSATTANALMKLNAEDRIKRKYILVQLPENLDNALEDANLENRKKLKNNIDFLNSVNRPHTLDQIGIERIIRAAKKIKEETRADIDYGFKHYELQEPNENTLDKLEKFDTDIHIADQSLLDEFGSAAILSTWAMRDGYGFHPTIEIIELSGYTAYLCNKHLYMIHPDITDSAIIELIEKFEDQGDFNPENIVLFGYSFVTWSQIEMLKNNIKQLNNSEKNLRVNLLTRY